MEQKNCNAKGKVYYTMNCLIINGSPHKGFTWKIVEQAKIKLQAMGDISFEEIMLMDIDIPFCRGCFSCFYHGEHTCPHADRVAPIVQKLLDADMLIITSPVYALHISSLLKNFFDHTAYMFHRPIMFEKKALVITSTAGGGAKKAAEYIRETLQHWGFNRVYTLPIITMGNTELTDKMKARCDQVAEAFYRDAKSRKLHPPTYKKVMFYGVWRRLTSTSSASKIDSAYWEKNGLWKHAYAPTVPLGPIKKLFGDIVYKLFSLVMK